MITTNVSFEAIREGDLPEVAAFMFEQQEQAARDDPTHAPASGDDLRWLLGNPDLRPDDPLGEVLRTPEGKLAGMILAVPRAYRLGDRRLRGLAAGNFYVDRSARMQGFFLLRRFLKTPGIDFYYANSCNIQSGTLWLKCGGAQVPESEVEYLFPFRLGPLIQEVALRKHLPWPSAGLARLAGAMATPLAAPRPPASRLDVEPCDDLERLATIAERDRDPEAFECERGVPYLRWIYGGDTDQAPSTAHHLYRFSDDRGNEGWFALNDSRRGRSLQVRAARLVDVVWPRRQIPLADVLAAIIRTAAPRSDVLTIRGRVGLGLEGGMPGFRRRTLPAPEAFLIGRTPPTADLIGLADFPFADRY
jgi:hypothetical protein